MAPSYQRRKPDDQTSRATPVLGWDIGGVNTKAARVEPAIGDGPRVPAAHRLAAYEIQRDPAALPPTLACAGRRARAPRPGWPHAVTMTAELSQAFRTKREGVAFVLDALAARVPRRPAARVHGRRPLRDARGGPSRAARGRRVELGGDGRPGRPVRSPTRILVDIGTTSTDIIPLRGGRVAARGRTDPARLLSRRAGLHRRRAHAGRGPGPRGAALGRSAPPCRPKGSRPSATRTSGWASSHPADYTVPDRRRPAGDAGVRRRAAGARGVRRPRDARRPRPSTRSPGRWSRRRSSSSPTASAGCARAVPARPSRW